MITKKKWIIVINDDDDTIVESVNFLNLNYKDFLYGREWHSKYFEWKIKHLNPVGKGFLATAKSNNKVIGTLTLTKKLLKYNYENIISYEIGDSYIKKNSYRKYEPEIKLENQNHYINNSIFGRMVNDILSNVYENNIIYGSPNNESLNGYVNKLNFENYKISNIISFISPSFFYLLNFKFFTFLHNFFKLFFNIIYKILIKILSLSISSNPPNLDNVLINENINKNYLSEYKDINYFKYRFIDKPYNNYNFCSIYGSKKELKAMIIYKIVQTKKNKNICYIIDIINNEINYFILFLIFRLSLNEKNIHFFCLWLNEKNKYKLLMNLFFTFKKIPVIFYKNKALKKLYSNRMLLNFSMSSFDVI